MFDASSISTSQSLSIQAQNLTEAPSLGASEQFLRLHLPDMTILLPVQQLTEVLTVSISQIVPIPHMPAWVMGVYNWRGEILWMVDLGHLCGLASWHQQTTSPSICTAVVLYVRNPKATSTRAANQALGLVVNQAEDIEWCDPDTFQSPPRSTVSLGLAPFLRGYWWKSNDEMLVVLNGEAILRAMPKPLV